MTGSTPLRIYEVHLASGDVASNTWDALAEQIGDHVVGLGFTHVELMPIAEHPFGGSWGYQVSGYYSPTARFGDPDGFRRFVDALHGRGVGVIVDWVPAHFPRDEWSLGRFDGQPVYEHPDPRRGEHPDWGTYVFDYGRNEVRNFLVANALYWLDQFHVDGLRVDAVASMLYLDYSRPAGQWDRNEYGGREHLEALAFLRETNAVVADEFPDALMIAEESTSWPGVTASTAAGGLGFTHKWNLGWMHDTLDYLALDPVYRSHHHHEMTFALLYAYDERFVLPLSHDEVVHGKGSLLAQDGRRRLAAIRSAAGAVRLAVVASRVAAGVHGRRTRARGRSGTTSPNCRGTCSTIAAHRGVFDLIGALNDAADAWPALWRRDIEPGGFQWLDADDAAHSLYAFVRWDVDGADGGVCIANFTPVPRPGYRVGLPWGGNWQVIIDTDDAAWWGSGHRGAEARVVTGTDEPWQSLENSAVLDIGPMSMIWFASRSPG